MKLYSVSFSTPHKEDNDLVLEADTVAAAKELFNKILSINTYFKVKFNKTEMIVASNSIKITKVTVYKA